MGGGGAEEANGATDMAPMVEGGVPYHQSMRRIILQGERGDMARTTQGGGGGGV